MAASKFRGLFLRTRICMTSTTHVCLRLRKISGRTIPAHLRRGSKRSDCKPSVPAPVSAQLGRSATCLDTRDLQTSRDHSILGGPTHSETLIPFRANAFRQLNCSPIPFFWHDSSADPVVTFSIRPSLITGKSQPYKPLI